MKKLAIESVNEISSTGGVPATPHSSIKIHCLHVLHLRVSVLFDLLQYSQVIHGLDVCFL